MNNENIKFEITPTIVQELGRNLYSADNSIIVELIANSYDADAKNVKIILDGEQKTITVSDDGWGMDRNIVKEGFLKVGNRNLERVSSVLGRKPLGRKGIGKLSFFAIGNDIKVRTIKNGEKISFNLSYESLKDQNNDIDLNYSEDDSDSGTKIEISNLVKGVTRETFLKKLIIGISQVFNDLLSTDFNIEIVAKKWKYINNEVSGLLDGKYNIKRSYPDFSQTCVFYSLDIETDKKMHEIMLNDAVTWMHKLKNVNGLKIEQFTKFVNSKETWKLLRSKKEFEKLKSEDEIDGTIIKYDIKGYVASVVRDKALGREEGETPKQSNDKITINENKKTITIIPSNRRISISSNGRSGVLNAKGSLGLSDKFYTKYLFGEIKSNVLENPNYKDDITLPNREGYRKDNDRWRFVRKTLQIIGNNAMDFVNGIAKKKKDKDSNTYKENIDSYINNQYIELEKISSDDIIRKLFKETMATTAERKYQKSVPSEKSFILISYTRKGDSSSLEKATIMAKILKKIVDFDGNSTRILFTGDETLMMGKKEDEKLYHVIKDNFGVWNDPIDYRLYHMFSFINDVYTNNWFTDIEYGMAFVNSRVSKHLIPKEITTFMTKGAVPDNIAKCSPITYDDLDSFSPKWMKENLLPILKKLKISITQEKMEEFIDSEF